MVTVDSDSLGYSMNGKLLGYPAYSYQIQNNQIGTPSGTWYREKTGTSGEYDRWRFDQASRYWYGDVVRDGGQQIFVLMPPGQSPISAELFTATAPPVVDTNKEFYDINPDKLYNPDLINTDWNDTGQRVNDQIVWERVFNGLIQTQTSANKPSNTNEIDSGSYNNVTKEPVVDTIIHHDTYKVVMHYWALGTLALSSTRLLSEMNNALSSVTGWNVDSVEIDKGNSTITAYFRETGSPAIVIAIAAAVVALAILFVFIVKYEIRKLDDALVSQQITAKADIIAGAVKGGMSYGDAVNLANEAFGATTTPSQDANDSGFLGISNSTLKYAAIGLFGIVALGMVKDLGRK